MANIDEMFADLAAADAAGDKELATVIASRIRQAESAAAQPTPAPIPEAAPQSRLQSFLSAASRTYTPELGITSPELAAAERQGMVKIAPEVVRYGVPIAAGIAAAPVVAPLGVAAGMASMAGIGGAASYTSELAAQKMAGEDIDQRKALAMGVAGATPFRGTGSLVARLGTNVPSALAASEAARYIENPEAYAAPSLSAGATENLIRFLPAGVAGAGTMIGKTGSVLAKKGELAQSIREGSQVAQQEFGVTMGRAPLLQDLFGGTATPAPGGSFISNLVEPAAIERAAIQRANPVAMQAMENALIGPSEGFAALSRSAPDLFPLTEEVRNNIGVLEPIYQAAKKSRDEAIVLTQRAQDLQIKGMAGASEALDLARAARLKAYAEEVVYNRAWEKSLGREAPNLKQISLGERNARIQQAGDIARDARSAVVSEAYKKAGIGENDAIVSLGDIIDTAEKKITANASKKEFLATIKSAFGDDVTTVLDRTQFLEARDKLAAEITKRNPGIDPTAATRKAGQFYQTMKEASESFIGRELPDKLALYQDAQRRAARFFDVADTKAYDLLAKGDAAGFYEAAKKTGASVGSVYNQAMEFTKALREEGAGAVADGLEKSINLAIRDGVLDNVVNRGTGFQGARIVRAPELVKELQSLKESGFPISRLALGKPEDIRVLARISSTTGGSGFTTSELNGFLDNVEKIGLDKATAKLNYERAVRNAFIETEPARKLKEAQKARIEARKSGLNAQQQEAIARQKESDPLIRFLNEPGSATSMGILNDPAKNADLVETLFSLEPTMVSRFMGSLRASGRSSQAEDVEKAVIARMFGKFGKGTEEIDLAGILDNFRNPAKLGTLNSLKSVLGPERFASLRENVVKPLDQLAKSYERAELPIPNSFYQLRSALVAGSLARTQSFSQSIKGSFIGANALRGAIEYMQNKQYNLLYKLYIDPTTAPKFAKAGYAIDKIMQQPVLAATYKLAQDMDAQQSQPTP